MPGGSTEYHGRHVSSLVTRYGNVIEVADDPLDAGEEWRHLLTRLNYEHTKEHTKP